MTFLRGALSLGFFVAARATDNNLVLLQKHSEAHVVESTRGLPGGECKPWCDKHADDDSRCNWAGCSGCDYCPAPNVPEPPVKLPANEEEPAGLAKPYKKCDATSDNVDVTCVTSRDGGKFVCRDGRCAGQAGRGDKCRDASYSGANHKANLVCNKNNKCVGFKDGQKWGECRAK